MKEITKEIKDYLLSVGYPDKEKIFYFDAWLWLWQHKGIWLDPVKTGAELFTCYLSGEHIIGYHSNPEEAIEAAIKYIVDNGLLK